MYCRGEYRGGASARDDLGHPRYQSRLKYRAYRRKYCLPGDPYLLCIYYHRKRKRELVLHRAGAIASVDDTIREIEWRDFGTYHAHVCILNNTWSIWLQGWFHFPFLPAYARPFWSRTPYQEWSQIKRDTRGEGMFKPELG